MAAAAGSAGSINVTLSSVTGTFAAGQHVFLHQTQAASGSVGFYEFGIVASVSGTTLTLTAPLTNTYVTDGTHHAQVVRVPQYTTVNVAAGGTLTASAWNGTTGGILVLEATSSVTVAGTVTMDGNGFRGTRNATCGVHNIAGIAGESQLGVGVQGPGTVGGPANGGGGAGGSRGQDCGEGGGGGYGAVGNPGGPRTQCGTGSPAGCSASVNDGTGGAAIGVANLASVVLFGGAGGEGGHDEDGGYAGDGGDGGGLIFIRSNTLGVTGTISSAGTAGGSGVNTCGDGCGMGGGGGGAGGAIRFNTLVSAALGSSRITATGAAGGTCTCGGGGNGGNGSVGRIGVLAPAASVTGTTSPTYDAE